MINQSQRKLKAFRSHSIKIATGLWLLSIITVTVSYQVSGVASLPPPQGGLMAVLTVPIVPPTVDTIAGLALQPLPISSRR